MELGRQVVELLLETRQGVGNGGCLAVRRDMLSAEGFKPGNVMVCQGSGCLRIITGVLQALLLAL